MSDDPAGLTGPRVLPADGGAPRHLVILLHGVGADGADLIELAPHWQALLPGAEFIAPDGPAPCDLAPYGRQWFSLQDRSPAALWQGISATAPVLDRFIDACLAERGLTPDQLALVGFSQGCMMALHVGLRRPQPLAAVLGYSGALIGPERLAEQIASRPPVLLIHGDADPVVPPDRLPAAVAALKAAGVAVTGILSPDLDHSIDRDGLMQGGEFLRRALTATPTA